jgi:SAM-dependent methyltransferase
MERQAVLIFHLWNARRKAKRVAQVEAVNLLRGLDPQVLPGGPLSERGGVFWIAIPERAISQAIPRLTRLGYTHAVDRVVEITENLPANPKRAASQGDLIRWNRRYHELVRLYAADKRAMRQRAPDRRVFMLKLADGDIHPVRGYRGDGQALSRRGLPPYDARMLVNLVTPDIERVRAMFLDPFAGIGGIVLEALAGDYTCVLSADNDAFLMHGLAYIGVRHCVADARRLPFADATVDAIATEPPYDEVAEAIVKTALAEMVRVLEEGARLAVFCAAWQAEGLRDIAGALPITPYLDSPVDRKGTDCVVLAWQKMARGLYSRAKRTKLL